MVLRSQLLGSSADLRDVAAGARTIRAPEVSDSVALVQQALLAIEAFLPDHGVDGVFGDETGQAVSTFKGARAISPDDPVVGPQTTAALDIETAYLEGTTTDQSLASDRILATDPLFAGTLDMSFPGVDQRVQDVFQFGDRLCFRVSFLLGSQVAQAVGRFVEPPIFADYCQQLPTCGPADFFDATNSSTPYIDFLLAQHANVPPDQINALSGRRRPDILSNRSTGQEWYEIKPASVAGAVAAWRKFNSIPEDYERLGLPYQPGRAYTPTEEITLGDFVGPEGEQLRLIVHAWRKAPGLIFYELCVKGDYVLYFNRVRLVAGILALLVAIPGLLPAAEEGGVIVAGVRALANALNVVLPLVVPAN